MMPGRDPDDDKYCIYGDKGYYCRDVLLCAYARRDNENGQDLTDTQISFNTAMNKGRIAVENAFGVVQQHWQALHAPTYWRIDGNRPGDWYTIAVFLTNCINCLRKNQISMYFHLDPPSLEEYFKLFVHDDFSYFDE